PRGGRRPGAAGRGGDRDHGGGGRWRPVQGGDLLGGQRIIVEADARHRPGRVFAAGANGALVVSKEAERVAGVDDGVVRRVGEGELLAAVDVADDVPRAVARE